MTHLAAKSERRIRRARAAARHQLIIAMLSARRDELALAHDATAQHSL